MPVNLLYQWQQQKWHNRREKKMLNCIDIQQTAQIHWKKYKKILFFHSLALDFFLFWEKLLSWQWIITGSIFVKIDRKCIDVKWVFCALCCLLLLRLPMLCFWLRRKIRNEFNVLKIRSKHQHTHTHIRCYTFLSFFEREQKEKEKKNWYWHK